MAIRLTPVVTAQIQVRDFNRAAGWLKANLGWEAEYHLEEMGWGEVRTSLPGLTLGLSAGDRPIENAVLVFGVEDIDEARAHLEANGVRFDGPTQEVPGMVRLATFFDPDGNRFMFAQNLMS